MENFAYILAISLLLLIIYMSSLVTYHTVKSDFFDAPQKKIIIFLAWIVPIIGPALIMSVLASNKPVIKYSGSRFLSYLFLAHFFNEIEGAKEEADMPGDLDSTSSDHGID
ncbi:MAG: hypothetical protein AseanaTS_21900 [Candidatus Pelagadaptatus aseana]